MKIHSKFHYVRNVIYEVVCHPKISGMLLCKSKIADQFREQALFGGKIWPNDKIKKENYFGAVASNAINSFSAFYLSSQKSSMKKYYSISTPLTCCLQSCLFVLCCRLSSYMSLKNLWLLNKKLETTEGRVGTLSRNSDASTRSFNGLPAEPGRASINPSLSQGKISTLPENVQ